MKNRSILGRLLGAALAAASLLLPVGMAGGASVAHADPSGDTLTLLRLTTGKPDPSLPAGTVHFETQVQYHLQSSNRAFIVLLLFENNAETSSQQTSQQINVQPGDGQISLNLDYLPQPNTKTVSLLAGMFRNEDTLLAWVSTNPFPF